MMTPCRLCGTTTTRTHTAIVLGRHEIAYFLCPQCDLLQTERPYWLEEAYQDSISTLDTGLVHRNLTVSRRVARFCFSHGLQSASGMDFAGGYGLLVRMLRDMGLNFFWSDKYSPNLVARGFEVSPEKKYDVVTAFEVLEHFNEPHQQIAEILEIVAPRFLLFETTLRKSKSVPGPEWRYYTLRTGQHVAFYSEQTLKFVATRFRYHFWREGHLLIFSRLPRPGKILRWKKLPGAWLKTCFPDSIPFIRRDQEESERRLARFQDVSE